MSTKTGDFIISLATQGGVTLDEDQTKAISEIATELPEGIGDKIQGNLFTKESALANPDIINKLKAESLDAVDQKMLEFATNFGLDEGFKHNLKETKGTYKRIDAVEKAILANHKVALVKAKEGAPAGDQEELNQKIIELNQQIVSHGENFVSKQDHEDMASGFEQTINENANAMLQMNTKNLFAGVNWAVDQVSNDINTTTALGIFNAELTGKNIKLVNKEGTLRLETQEGTPYFVDNKEVTPQELAKSLVARDKLEKVTQPNPSPTPTPVPGGGNGLDASVVSALAQAEASNQAVVASGATT